MTKSELIELIAAKQSHLPAKDVELAVKQILEIMSDALAQGQRIEIRGFGSFSLHFRPPRQGRNPKTGETVALAGKYVPHFKPGKDLRERVNEPDEVDAPASRSAARFRSHLHGRVARGRGPGMLRRVAIGLALAGIALLAMLFTSLNQQSFTVDVAFFKFEVTAGLALIVIFAAGLLVGALAASRWVGALLAERGRLRQALRLAETRLGAAVNAADVSDAPLRRSTRPGSMHADSKFWLTLVGTLAAGWALTSWRVYSRRKRRVRRRARYLEGVRFLLDDKPDRALEVFLSLAELDDETVDTHFALGSLYRRRGEVDRAIRVHQHIVDRSSLQASHREAALTELARDYLRAGLYDRAEQLFQDLADNGKTRRWRCST